MTMTNKNKAGVEGIHDFYRNKEIFITGGSGFIGKLLIEKLLRSCPDIGCIYVLMRSKKGKNVNERMRVFLSEPVFERVRREQPEALKKVQAIAGDCAELGLAVSNEDLVRLKNVKVVFHSAATVRFDEPLRDSIILNTRGTLELCKLAERSMPHLQAFIHVSTAYSHPDHPVCEERIYEPYADWRTTIKLAETYSAETLEIFVEKYAPDHPNTYTFAKSLAEQIINDYRHKLPVLIFRPSVVITAFKEPSPGWLENFNGPIGLTYAIGFGFSSSLYSLEDKGVDLIPVDVVVRSLILTAFKCAILSKQNIIKNSDEAYVIQCAGSKYHAITNRVYCDIGTQCAYDNPFDWAIWTPTARITNCFYWYWLQTMLLDVTRAMVLDLLLKAFKQRPFCMNAQRRIFLTNVMLHHFTSRHYDFDVDNCLALNQLLHDSKDIEDFNVNDLKNFDFKQLFVSSIRAVRVLKLKTSGDPTRGALIRVRVYAVLSKLIPAYGVFYIMRSFWRAYFMNNEIS